MRMAIRMVMAIGRAVSARRCIGSPICCDGGAPPSIEMCAPFSLCFESLYIYIVALFFSMLSLFIFVALSLSHMSCLSFSLYLHLVISISLHLFSSFILSHPPPPPSPLSAVGRAHSSARPRAPRIGRAAPQIVGAHTHASDGRRHVCTERGI